jgi:hypothetical protein
LVAVRFWPEVAVVQDVLELADMELKVVPSAVGTLMLTHFTSAFEVPVNVTVTV